MTARPAKPRRRRRWWLLVAAACAPVGALAVASTAMRVMTSARIHEDVRSTPPRSVAIVLGARVYADGRPSAVLEDRLAVALELYRSRKVRRVLVTGDHGTRGYDEVAAMHRWLVAHGVPEDDVFLDHAGFRTLDSMQRAARVFLVRDAILCTQDFHLPRALYLAEDAGIDAVGVRADRRVYRSAAVNFLRETVARSVAFIDVHVTGRQARHFGPVIPIDGPAAPTRDRTPIRAHTR